MYQKADGEKVRVPAGGRCLPCSLAVATCFLQEWSEVLRRVKTDPEFSKVFALARSFLKGRDPSTVKAFVEQTLDTIRIYGTRLETVTDFLSEADFVELYGVAPEQVLPAERIVETTDEFGQSIKGVLVIPDGDRKPTRKFHQFVEDLLLKKDPSVLADWFCFVLKILIDLIKYVIQN